MKVVCYVFPIGLFLDVKLYSPDCYTTFLWVTGRIFLVSVTLSGGKWMRGAHFFLSLPSTVNKPAPGLSQGTNTPIPFPPQTVHTIYYG